MTYRKYQSNQSTYLRILYTKTDYLGTDQGLAVPAKTPATMPLRTVPRTTLQAPMTINFGNDIEGMIGADFRSIGP